MRPIKITASMATGLKLSKALKTNASYRILDAGAGSGGTWACGGCNILADALARLFPTGQKVGLVAGMICQHVGFEVDGMVFDADGGFPRRAWRRKFIHAEHPVGRVSVCEKFSLGDVPADVTCSARLAIFLARVLRLG